MIKILARHTSFSRLYPFRVEHHVRVTRVSRYSHSYASQLLFLAEVEVSHRNPPLFGQGHVCGVENMECQQELCLLSSLQVGPRVCPVAHSQRQSETSSQASA